MTNKTKQTKNTSKIIVKHDQLFKKILENKIAARNFLETYTPDNFKKICNFQNISPLKHSYIDHDLKDSANDVVFKVKTINDDDAFIITIIEHQSKSDYWMTFRILKYTLSLLQTYVNDKTTKKLPLVTSIIYYNGTSRYNAPLNFFDLFQDPKLAEEIMTGKHKLVDLSSMDEEEIVKSGHIATMNFFMKHIWERDILQLWKNYFDIFASNLRTAQGVDFIYITNLLWYTIAKVPEANRDKLIELINNNLSGTKKGDDIMRTIAESYLHQGIVKGKAEGEALGVAKGEALGEAKTIKLMLNNGLSIEDTMKITGFSKQHLDYLLSLDTDHK